MVDKLTPERRSWQMSRVRGKDTAPELRVRRVAHGLGLRFRLHRADLPGKPDIVLPRHRTVVFVHGCFWHRHDNCRRASTPATRQAYWLDKFGATKRRDLAAREKLQAQGWQVITIWECETSNAEKIVSALAPLIETS